MSLKTVNPNKLKSFKDIGTVYCAGCFHGSINRLIGEVIDSFEQRLSVIGVNAQGCGSFIADYMNFDFIEAPPGQAPAVASGIKNVLPDKLVFTYQGDGDMISYGMDSILHAAARGEKITVIMVNNLIDAQTGGQMSPTTIVGQITQTTPYGRSVERIGKQIKFAEMVAKVSGSCYVSRVTVDTPTNFERARKALTEAFLFQLEGKGFTFIEFLSLCPTYWEKDPVEARQWLQEKIIKEFPLGLFKRSSTRY